MQGRDLKLHIKQLEATAKEAQATAHKAEQQYQLHLQQMQAQLEHTQHQTDTFTKGPTASESPLAAELQSLTRQLAEAQQQITPLQADSSSATVSKVLPSSNPGTPAKPAAGTSATQDSAAVASAEKDSAKDKDTQLAECKQRLVKAKKYIQNLKQQAADATAAKEQALIDLQSLQQQQQQQQLEQLRHGRTTEVGSCGDSVEVAALSAEVEVMQVTQCRNSMAPWIAVCRLRWLLFV